MKKIWEKLKCGDNLPILIIAALYVVLCCCFWGRCVYLFFDVGRELIIPEAILNGKVLYKDILNIYGPLSYYINALAYKIGGIKPDTLFTMGALAGLVFTYSFYFIAREFTGKKLSILLTSFMLVTCMFNSGLFNFLFPYSYSVPYGLASYALTILMLIKYVKSGDEKFVYIASISSGFAISNKIEFFMLPIILAATLLFIKPLNKKSLLKSIGLFFVFPIISLIGVLLQGNSFSDLIVAMEIIKKSAISEPMVYFHQIIGLYPSTVVFLSNLSDTLRLFIIILFCSIGYLIGTKFKFLNLISLPILVFLCIALDDDCYFSLFPIILMVLSLINIKKIWLNKPLLILVISSFGASLKTFFSLKFNSYGEYTLPLLMLSFCIVMITSYKPKFNLEKYLTYILIMFVLSYGTYNCYVARHNLTYKMNVANSSLFVEERRGILLGEVAEYIKKNTKGNDRILVYPEAALINFMTNREPDYMYYSLHPIFMETFGEENIVKRIKDEKIEYIILIKADLTKSIFGKEHYYYFNRFVNNSYALQKTFSVKDAELSIQIYKLTLY